MAISVFPSFPSDLTLIPCFLNMRFLCSPLSILFSFRMLKVGLPVGAVKNALQRDGQDPSIMDLDQNRYVVICFVLKYFYLRLRCFPYTTLPYHPHFICAIAGPSKSSSTKGINTGNLRCRNGCEVFCLAVAHGNRQFVSLLAGINSFIFINLFLYYAFSKR